MSTVETKENQSEKNNPGIWNSFEACLIKYARFKGRSSRFEFWSFYLVSYAIATLLVMFDKFILNFFFLSGLFSLSIFLPKIAVSVRRLHDINRSGWWFLLPSISVILILLMSAIGAMLEYVSGETSPFFIYGAGFSGLFYFASKFYLLYLYCKKGDQNPNRFDEKNI